MKNAEQPRSGGELRRRIVHGVELGVVTGLAIAAVDLINATRVEFSGNRMALLAYVPALTVPMSAAAGALLASWWQAARGIAARLRHAGSHWRLAALQALPISGFAMYPPASWIAQHGREFGLAGQLVAGLVLLAIALGSVVAVAFARRFGAWLARENRAVARARAATLAAALLAAAACYGADARLYPDDYPEFHDGLAGAFAGSLAIGFAVLRAAWLRRRPTALAFRRAVLAIGAMLAVLLGVLENTRADAFGASGALVFGKLVEQTRRLSDLDGDGYAAVLGGHDCAAFDARRSPATTEVPENGIDEDCSGADERWPIAPPAPRRGKKRHNVLLITIDTLRADHLGVYGYNRPTSPHIDRFARGAVVFSHAFAQASKTWDSVPSFLTGRYPSNLPRDYRHERVRKAPPYAYYLKREAGLIAEAFAASGYRTSAAVSVSLLRNMGLHRGFQRYERRHLTSEAKKVLANARAPFFLWLHYRGPHAPYQKHRRYDFGNQAIDRYDSEIAAEDAEVGAVLTELAARDLDNSTVVIITSDHGEEFGEHGGYAHTRKHYRELLHVPLILKAPGVAPARVADVVELVDIAPTLYELCRVKPPHRSLDGQSLLATLRKPRPIELGGAYAEDVQSDLTMSKRALLHGGFRLIDDRVHDRQELYDVDRDPLERRDIAAARPEVVQRMRERIAVRALRGRSPRHLAAPAPAHAAAAEDPTRSTRSPSRLQP